VLPPFYRTMWFLTLAALSIGAAAFLLFQRRVSQIKLKHAAELAFTRRLIDSQERERKRFAAEMHDGLGQSLVIIKNRARLSLKQSDQKEAMLDHLENISATASHAIEEAREIAFNLRPHLLDRLGLTKTIESMLGKVFSAGDIEFEAEIDLIDDVLEKDSEILLAIIFLTIHSEEAMFHAALDLGAKGYVLKDSAIDDIVTAINEVVAGRAFTSLPMTSYFTRRQNYNAVPDEQQSGLRQLTRTEYRILKLLADYKTNKDIAGELSVSPRTVETHRVRICQKLNLHGSHALMKFAVQYKSLL